MDGGEYVSMAGEFNELKRVGLSESEPSNPNPLHHVTKSSNPDTISP